MQRQLEVQLGDLVVDDEDDLVMKRGLGALQAEQRVQVNQVPICAVVGIQKPVEVAAEVLPHGRVLFLKQLQLLEDRRVK